MKVTSRDLNEDGKGKEEKSKRISQSTPLSIFYDVFLSTIE